MRDLCELVVAVDGVPPVTATCVLCVLHGGQQPPRWMHEIAGAMPLYIAINDGRDNSYEVPAGAHAYCTTRRQGFAVNVNQLVTLAFAEGADTAVVANFDVQCQAEAVKTLLKQVRAEQPAVAGALLRDADGRVIFSAGRYPTPLKELVRGAGLDTGGLRRVRRTLLRAMSSSWRQRNSTGGGSRRLTADEYLPWTLIAFNRAAWDVVGPLDERFPLYAEDIDWGRRAASAGVAVSLVDVGNVEHTERATAGLYSDTVYEVSHRELHRKYNRRLCLGAQSLGLGIRRVADRTRRRQSIDWSLLAGATRQWPE